MEVTFSVETLAAIGIFVTPITLLAVRFWIKREKCFTVIEQKVNNLTIHDEGSEETHKDIFERLNNLDKNVHLILGAMKITPVD